MSLRLDPSMPQSGDFVSQRYRIEDVVAEGGHSVVYSATDCRTGQTIALKVLDPLLSRRPSGSARFEQELAILARLRHPSFVRVHDAGQTASGCLYIATELLHGETLRERLDRGPLEPADAAEIAVEVLGALTEAHDAGIIHRDLKPSNIHLSKFPDGSQRVSVLDFGIAKVLAADTELTQTGDIVCSPHYVAPERLLGSDAIPASDLYSLGVILIEATQGSRPYYGTTPMAITTQHASPTPVPFERGSAGALARVIAKAVAKSPERRFGSATEMAGALQQALAGERGFVIWPAIAAAALLLLCVGLFAASNAVEPDAIALVETETAQNPAPIEEFATPPTQPSGLPVPVANPSEKATGLLAPGVTPSDELAEQPSEQLRPETELAAMETSEPEAPPMEEPAPPADPPSSDEPESERPRLVESRSERDPPDDVVTANPDPTAEAKAEPEAPSPRSGRLGQTLQPR